MPRRRLLRSHVRLNAATCSGWLVNDSCPAWQRPFETVTVIGCSSRQMVGEREKVHLETGIDLTSNLKDLA